MELLFPALEGGQEQGLNDAGVEAFQGSIGQYVVRECAQNSGDAPASAGSVVRVEFDVSTWSTRDIPCISELTEKLKACREYWKDDEKTKRFFDAALVELRHGKLRVLRVGDYGTTGLIGGDNERNKGWFALVKSQGVSVKQGDLAGGSFGIGKSSPFAASRLRTVFYSTRTSESKVALQGISRLVTHRGVSGKTTQAVGFIGGYLPGEKGRDPIFTAIRDPEMIPNRFRRDQVGTDIYILGYYTHEGNWERELVVAILNNFWPAIHRGTMEFKVGGKEIAADNLGQLINSLRGTPEFRAYQYYGAVVDRGHVEIETRLPTVGTCGLYLTTSGDDLSKDVCMMRKAGMIITTYRPQNMRTNYSGLFVCEESKGNRLLRAMEPPRHDQWDPKRVEGPMGRQALSEIRGWIRDEVRKLNPIVSGKSFDEEDLSKYLPELEDQGVAAGGESQDPGSEPGLYGVPTDKPADATTMPPGSLLTGATDGSGGSETGEQPGGTTGPPAPFGGDGKNTGGRMRGRSKGGRSGIRGLSLRSYAAAPDLMEYIVVLRSEKDFSGALGLVAAGDDKNDPEVALSSCVDVSDGRDIAVSGNRISDIQLSPARALTLRLRLKRPQRLSLTLEQS